MTFGPNWTLDPPAGATGTASPTHVVVGSTPSVSFQTLLRNLDRELSAGFAHGTTNQQGAGTNYVINIGTHQSLPFNITAGDTLDLSQALAGVPIGHDLASFSQYVQVVSHTPGDPTTGTDGSTTFEIAGPNGHATVTLEGSGKLGLQDLLDKNSLIHH